ncbi:MAG: hypothetical protein IKR04_02845 [Clostridia bacterium]|nr:hypothetical protein [Clostridia bacterium]
MLNFYESLDFSDNRSIGIIFDFQKDDLFYFNLYTFSKIDNQIQVGRLIYNFKKKDLFITAIAHYNNVLQKEKAFLVADIESFAEQFNKFCSD